MGAPDQVFKFDNTLDYLLGGINANSISAIGTLNPGSMCIQYLYAPQIHFDLSGNPIALISNSSNKKGEISLIKVDITSIRFFPFIMAKANFDSHLLHGDNIPTELVSETNWKDFIDPFIGTLGPSFFVLYIWQSFPHGDIRDDEIMSKLIRLGSGYELWANTAKNAVEHLDDILSAMDTITTSKKYQEISQPNLRQ
jgi:hypothetical protein